MNKIFFGISFASLMISLSIGVLIGFTDQILGTIKPITLFQYSFFLTFAFGINMLIKKEKILKYKDLILTISFFILMASFYEILWNFFAWFSLFNFYGLGTDIDKIVYHDPVHKSPFNFTEPIPLFYYRPVNLNIQTKNWSLIFFCALYLIVKILTIKPKKNVRTRAKS